MILLGLHRNGILGVERHNIVVNCCMERFKVYMYWSWVLDKLECAFCLSGCVGSATIVTGISRDLVRAGAAILAPVWVIDLKSLAGKT